MGGDGARIVAIRTADARFPLERGVGTDSANRNPIYSYGVTLLDTDRDITGVGLAFTLGGGNRQLCELIKTLSERLVGREIEELMSGFAREFRHIADEPHHRWLGPHKGLVHLALSSITNACFDLWAKSRGVPLWRLLLDLDAEALVATMDFTYVEDLLTAADAIALLRDNVASRSSRAAILDRGYPAYDASVGSMAFNDEKLAKKARESIGRGFAAVKLNVGSTDRARDLRRAKLLRSQLGESVKIMIDANQAWGVESAIAACGELADMKPFWLEDPTHPDDVLGHAVIAKEVAPLLVATGKHIPNRVMFKQLLQANAADVIQADAVRIGGISEFLTVSLMARRRGKAVVPHVGDMGQIHQHLVLFNHVALGHEALFLSHMPHLRSHFLHPAIIEDGVYWTPEEPGSASDLISTE